MNLETERIILKSISKEDREFIYSQFSDDVVTKYLYDEEPLTDMIGADEIIDSYIHSENVGLSRWILVRKFDTVKMGTCGFHCWNQNESEIDIGYDLKQAFWGNGYMHEAMKAIMNLAIQEIRVKQINAHIYFENKKSISLAKKLGFTFSGKEYNCTFRGKDYFHQVYSLHISPEVRKLL